MEVAKAVLLDGQYPDLSQLHSIRSAREPSIEYRKDLIPDGAGRHLESLHAMLDLESNPTFQDEIPTQDSAQRDAFDDWVSSERRSTDLNSIYVASDQIDQCARQSVSSFELMDDTPLDLSSLNSQLEPMHYQDTILTADKRPGETEEASTQPETDSSSTKQVSHTTHVRNQATETTASVISTPSRSQFLKFLSPFWSLLAISSTLNADIFSTNSSIDLVEDTPRVESMSFFSLSR